MNNSIDYLIVEAMQVLALSRPGHLSVTLIDSEWLNRSKSDLYGKVAV